MGKKTTSKASADTSSTSAPAAEPTASEAPAKPRKPNKPRSTPPIRKIKASPAGHFADSLSAVAGRLRKIQKLTSKWASQNPAASGLAAKGLIAAEALRVYASDFAALADSGFAFRMSFARGPKASYVVGQHVSLSPAALELLHADFGTLTEEHDVRVAQTYKDGDKAIPLVLPREGKEDLFLGRVSYKLLNKPSWAVAA